MLPKFANQILHHTSRAVAAVQNQTTHTIRNVLQTPSSSTTIGSWNGTGSSSWGYNGGAGPGGAKYNSSSRFYSGYTGSGRAVTQANSSTAHDDGTTQNDDADELKSNRPSLRSPRSRRHSLSVELHGRAERGRKLGVLRTVQMHVRSRHAFAKAPGLEDSQESTILISSSVSNSATKSVPSSSSQRVVVRRNSTATLSASDHKLLEPPPVLPQTDSSPHSDSPTAFRLALPWETLSDNATPTDRQMFEVLKAARDSNDAVRAIHEVRKLRQIESGITPATYNMAFQALHATRTRGEPLNFILETYNDMVNKSILPNLHTYCLLILALTDRDEEGRRAIVVLQSRIKRRQLLDRNEVAQKEVDERRIANLRNENNFASAMSLFQAAIAVPAIGQHIPLLTYSVLLRSCAYHGSLDAAIHVYAHLEGRGDVKPSPHIFKNLISVFTSVGDLQGAKQVFDEFLSASKSGRIAWENEASDAESKAMDVLGDKQRTGLARSAQLAVWNTMIEAYFRCGKPEGALGLLEQMMDTQAGGDFGPADVPPPASSTFTQIVSGFCQSGDVQTALTWFDKLLMQETTARHPFESSVRTPRPDSLCWIMMIETLLRHEMIDELNARFKILLESAARDGLIVRFLDRCSILDANLNRLSEEQDHEKALRVLDFLAYGVFGPDGTPFTMSHIAGMDYFELLISEYLRHGSPEKAMAFLDRYADLWLRQKNDLAASGRNYQAVEYSIGTSKIAVLRAISRIFGYDDNASKLPLQAALRALYLLDVLEGLPSPALAQCLMHTYALARRNAGMLSLPLSDWELLAYAATAAELPSTLDRSVEQVEVVLPNDYTYEGVHSFIKDLELHQIDPVALSMELQQRLVQALVARSDVMDTQQFVASLSTKYQALYKRFAPDISPSELPINAPASDIAWPQPVIVSTDLSRYVDEHYPQNPKVTPVDAYDRFLKGLQLGHYPAPETIGRLISALGRLGKLVEVRILYDAAQIVLAFMEHDKESQSLAWFQIEDQMVIAYAHAGEKSGAHVHRTRILEHGGVPSADAYGALIQSTKDTTDDVAHAMTLWEESQVHGVLPNVFLYNVMISKLAKARKADYALELFQQMKAMNCQPSSVTYGAVIAACSRVGDAQSAEHLFREMHTQRNFRPRVPPYNTMMQLYVQTKPDRERVLYYYNALLADGVQPTSHTYKLLLDAFGTIEPIDIPRTEQVFERLVADKKVKVTGAHWASLISAHGCVQKDLDKAIEVFESIADHPSTVKAESTQPDAIAYEALINVFVILRKTELIPQYITRLRESGIHMTAYIANLMIKGYAAAGQLEQSRLIFESLEDPPEGVAAPNNHDPHSGGQKSNTKVPADAPVYREPSTWEAMVRAELGSGNRENAVKLLERLQARKFPPAVYDRISGIMLDDAVSPWPASPDASSPSEPTSSSS